MAYTKVSVPRRNTTNSPGAPTPKNATVIVIDVDTIDSFPERDANGVLLDGAITLLAGEKAVGVYATPGSISRNDASEGDADAEAFTQNGSFKHPGNSLAIDEFAQNWVGKNCVIITRGEHVSDTRVHGSPTNPVRITYEGQDNNEANVATFTFVSSMRGKKAAHYHGAMPALAIDATYDGSSGGGI